MFGGIVLMSEADTSERKIINPFNKRECLSLKEAAGKTGKSRSTMIAWCDKHVLGRQIVGSTWSVSKVALAIKLDGDLEALKAYHAGNRSDPRVAAYFIREGLEDLIK